MKENVEVLYLLDSLTKPVVHSSTQRGNYMHMYLQEKKTEGRGEGKEKRTKEAGGDEGGVG